MFRYLAFIWDSSSSQQCGAAASIGLRLLESSNQWREVLSNVGIRVFCADTQAGSFDAVSLANGQGVVVGCLFDAPNCGTSLARVSFGSRESTRISETGGRSLMSEQWGTYVAFLREVGSNRIRVIKDPTGGLPCLSTELRDVTIVFSCVADYVDLGLGSLTINKAYLHARLIIEGDFPYIEGLNEIARIHGGECVTIDYVNHRKSVRREFYWTPLMFEEARNLIEEQHASASAMRAAVKAATHALAARHSRVLTKLSGGLDSSIIAGCLRDAPAGTQNTCYTYFIPGNRSSELPWARMAAQHCGVRHIEVPIDPATTDLAPVLEMLPAVEPVMGMSYLQRLTVERPIADETGSTAVFSGDGGDSGFCSLSMSHAVTSYLQRFGPRLEAVRLASQIAARNGTSTQRLLFRSLGEWLAGPRRIRNTEAALNSCVLVAPELRSAIFKRAVPSSHRWFTATQQVVPNGLIDRLGMLPYTPAYYFGNDQRATVIEEVAPLYSQPALETLLRIPLYRHCEGGRDRALARRAFVDDVPAPILARVWKDRAPGFHRDLIRRNRQFLRELFLDGILVREGLLNRNAVEEVLSGAPTRLQVYPGEILAHMDTEVWVRSWVNRVQCRAAA